MDRKALCCEAQQYRPQAALPIADLLRAVIVRLPAACARHDRIAWFFSAGQDWANIL